MHLDTKYRVFGTTANMAAAISCKESEVLDTIRDINEAAARFFPTNCTPIITTVDAEGRMWFLIEISFGNALLKANPF
jgi:hypothetical protein